MRPTWSGVVVATAEPERIARKKFVFDSIVVVLAPSGRLRNAHTAPRVSASVINAPPCRTPPAVQRVGCHAMRPSTVDAVAVTIVIPHSAANGIICSRESASGIRVTVRLRPMKGWAAALALFAVVVAAAVGLWVTWDSTQTSATNPQVSDALTLPSTTHVTAPPGKRTRVTEPVPPCSAGDATVTTDPDHDWSRVVIDTGHRLSSTYVPPDLVSITQAGFDNADQVRAFVIPDLAAMREAAERAGAPLHVVSAYRSYSYQEQLFQQRTDEVGEAQASLRTARPGHSEHQLGTAIDVLDPANSELTPAFATTTQGRWVATHAHEYGFVLSYPEGERPTTCYEYEPWHLRYVGKDVADAIAKAQLTPRQWMLSAEGRAGNGG